MAEFNPPCSVADLLRKKPMLKARYGRILNYLRVSVTDRCNLRCRYCIPPGGFPGFEWEVLLNDDEMIRLVECFAELGVEKIRLTGGEPLLRKNLASLVREFSRLPGVKDISLSTNGVFLAGEAERLFKAGLRRINISLDTFDRERFRWITGLEAHGKVLEGIQAALRAGFDPVKVNVVTLKGINDDEVENFTAFAFLHPVELRFIELMPARNCFLAGQDQFVSNDRIKAEVSRFGELIPEPRRAGDVAEGYRLRGGKGKIGFISSITRSFCSDCNRIRLRSDGILRLCLHGEETLDLRTPLRLGASRLELKSLIHEAVQGKPKGHAFKGLPEDEPVTYMCQVGG